MPIDFHTENTLLYTITVKDKQTKNIEAKQFLSPKGDSTNLDDWKKKNIKKSKQEIISIELWLKVENPERFNNS